MLKFMVFFFYSMAFALFAERGIVVAVNDRFAKEFFFASLTHLRTNLHCDLPLEIWHSGDELSDNIKKHLGKCGNLVFRDIAQELRVDPNLYRGWHIKPKIIALSRFDEVILMDADLFFFANPEMLFSEPGYLSTGAFFFRDLRHLFPLEKSNIFTLERYLNRRNFIQSLVSSPSNCVPFDVREFWSHSVPSFGRPFIGDLQDSGCVAMDKKRHSESLRYIIELNENRAETYQYVHGDKETFWLGCEMACMPYHMNEQRPYSFHSGKQNVPIIQFLEDRLFYQQKKPEPIAKKAIFYRNDGLRRSLTDQQKESIQQACRTCYEIKKKLRE